MYQNAFYILGGKDFCFKDNSSLNTVFGQKLVRVKDLTSLFQITKSMLKPYVLVIDTLKVKCTI